MINRPHNQSAVHRYSFSLESKLQNKTDLLCLLQTQTKHLTPPWDEQPAGWAQTSQARPAEMIPFQWSSQQSRKKVKTIRRYVQGSTNLARRRLTTPPIWRICLRVGNRALLRRYYEKAFEDLQLNCRAISQTTLLVEPRKQVHYPYNGRRVIAGVSQRVDPEFTKPAWWPAGVLHKEPDHLLKPGEHAAFKLTE